MRPPLPRKCSGRGRGLSRARVRDRRGATVAENHRMRRMLFLQGYRCPRAVIKLRLTWSGRYLSSTKASIRFKPGITLDANSTQGLPFTPLLLLPLRRTASHHRRGHTACAVFPPRERSNLNKFSSVPEGKNINGWCLSAIPPPFSRRGGRRGYTHLPGGGEISPKPESLHPDDGRRRCGGGWGGGG